jgi:tetratricopeptide (TPR) repeat protein
MNNELIQARDILTSQYDVGRALSIIKPYIYAHPIKNINNDFDDIEADYHLMKNFMLKGYKDPKRDGVYSRLVRQLYELCNNAIVQEMIIGTNTYSDAFGQSRSFIADQTSVTQMLESFVQDVALISLDNGENNKEKLYSIYSNHQAFIHKFFCAILVSRQWKDSECDFISQLLLSPTIEINDACIIISSITLSAINVFDFNKFKTLSCIYLNAIDEKLKQRALVGIMLTLPNGEENIYHELKDIISDIIADKNAQKEILELQLQFFYCLNADADARKIRSDIMPNIIKNNNLTITRAGIMEKDEDPMNDILDPGAADKAMEDVEKSFHSMIDMQKQGSDIYFGGFSQMKRFSFFYQISNWFCPFYLEHPDLNNISEKLRSSKFLQLLLKHGPFCDSDKYSFALSMATVVMNMPDNIKEMLDSEDALGPTVNVEDASKPAYLRRMYLQDLFRFFRLYQSKQDFSNPFVYEGSKGLFFCNPLIRKSLLGFRVVDVLKFLMNHHILNKSINHIINLYDLEESKDIEYIKISALVKIKEGMYKKAYEQFSKVLDINPYDPQALKGMAKAAFHENNYEKAIDCYEKLISLSPDDYHLLLDKAILQVNTKDIDQGMKILFKLNYDHSSDINVLRAIAWGYLRNKKPEKASDIYDKLLEKRTTPADYLNCGYSKWFQNDIEGAVKMFKNFIKSLSDNDNMRERLYNEFSTDEQLLKSYNISLIETKIIIDIVLD